MKLSYNFDLYSSVEEKIYSSPNSYEVLSKLAYTTSTCSLSGFCLADSDCSDYYDGVKLPSSGEKPEGNSLPECVNYRCSDSDMKGVFFGVVLKEDYDAVRPGQLFISLLSEGKIDWIQLEKGGVREFIQCDYSKLALLFPGIIQGLIKSGADSFEDGMLVNLAKAMVKLVENNYAFPDIFSDIHEKVAALIHKHIAEKKAT